MAVVICGNVNFGMNFDNLDLSPLVDGIYLQRGSTFASIQTGVWRDNYYGTGFQYNGNILSGGTVTRYQETLYGQTTIDISGLNIPVSTFAAWASSGDNFGALQFMLSGADSIQGSSFGDLVGGFAGADTIMGGGGNDSILGGDGANYLRGDTGNDLIAGGADFDDINGNMGNDSCVGGGGNDWVVGGKDNDLLLGEEGDDIVYGNLGRDSCIGGVGDDLIRGGQDDDVLLGGDGNDWLSGDKGDDVIEGGAGADIFHTFALAGVDIVTDFSRAEGDRVQLDPGTTYSVYQSGADTIIDMGGGNQMILRDVQVSTLTGDWIFTL